MLLVVVPAVIVVVMDQIVKAFALRHLASGMPLHVIDGFLALRLGFNPGLAFGLLGGLDAGWRWVVWLLSIAALIALARIAYRILGTSGRLARLTVGLIFGGAVGNLIDRARHGAVVDFIDVYWGRYHWPAFNTADSAITVGVIVLALTLMRQGTDSDASR